MTGVDIEAVKVELRRQATRRRALAAAAAGNGVAEAVADIFLAHVALRAGLAIGAYWPIRDEIDCRPLLARLQARGHAVCLPVTRGAAPLTMRVWAPDTPLLPSGFGTLAPGAEAPEMLPDIMVMPLLAFDAEGNRLGYGKGHYDRTLAMMPARPLLVGLAFAGQQLPAIPHAPHDIRMDMVVTEAGLVRPEPTEDR